MSQTRKVVLAVLVLCLVIALVPAVWFASLELPTLLAQFSSGDNGTVFVAVAGAFGFAFVISVPRQR